eukprot:s877_g5.t1
MCINQLSSGFLEYQGFDSHIQKAQILDFQLCFAPVNGVSHQNFTAPAGSKRVTGGTVVSDLGLRPLGQSVSHGEHVVFGYFAGADMFYFCNVSSGGAATKVIGRSQTLSVEVSINTVLSFTVYECPEPVFTPETARCLGLRPSCTHGENGDAMAVPMGEAAKEVLTFHDYVEGVDAVAAAMDACHRTIYRGRTLGVISTEDLAGLSRSTMFLQVEVAFAALADLEEQLTDTGMLSLVDLPSPEKDTLWATQDLLTLYHSTLRDADGVLVVVDASKYEVPQWMGNMLRSVFKQEEGDFEERSAALQPSDAWIVANRMDQLPEFFCKDGSKELCKKVMERQYENYKDVIVDQEHVIPIAARLSSLAIYGKEKIQEPISQHLARLERQPWFAQACALLFGIRWADQVKEVDSSRWRSSMRELMLLGQVTGTLANSVLKTAYVNMLPRSVARVMQELSQLAWSFCSALSCLEGTSSEIQV